VRTIRGIPPIILGLTAACDTFGNSMELRRLLEYRMRSYLAGA
jgi:hypothetical protein